MKGLLLKDYYMIRSAILILLLVFVVAGICLSYLVNSWIFIVISTVMLGMNVASTIIMDKTSGWIKSIAITSVSKTTLIDSKYVMYFLLSILGLVLGFVVGMIHNVMIGGDTKMIGLFICISISMALISGSVIIPSYFLLDETKSVIGTILAYPISASIIAGIIYLLGNTMPVYIFIFFIAFTLFIISRYVLDKRMSTKDI